MTFWIIALLICAGLAWMLVRTLLIGQDDTGEIPAENPDMQIYRDQMAELERDLARGTLAEDEAERARAEIARRILAADKEVAQATSGPGARINQITIVLIGFVLVAGTGGLYRVLGAPGYQDMPLNARIDAAAEFYATRPSQAEVEASLPPYAQPDNIDPTYLELVERLRDAVAENPEDPRGLDLLAQSEGNLRNFVAAARLKERAVAAKGAEATVSDYADLGDMLVLAAGGYVSPEAEEALMTALRTDPTNGPGRYYIGLMQAQIGRPDIAFGIWQDLLAQSTPDLPWYGAIRAQIGDVAALAGIRYTLPPETALPEADMPGPDAADIEAAEDMTDADREQMIFGMVERLAERLSTEGGTPEEWARLINALVVVRQPDRAAAIWQEAQTVFADSEDALKMIDQAAREAGLGE